MKKAFVYTLFAMAFLFALSMYVFVQRGSDNRAIVAEKIRSDETGFFVAGVQEDFGRGIMISSRRAIVALANYEINNGTFVNEAFGLDANQSILGLLQNGSIQGTVFDIMANSTVSYWSSSLRNLGERRNIEINISALNVGIAPSSAFEIIATGNAWISVYDPLTRIRYNRTLLLREPASLEDLEDPYVTVKSLGAIKNTIKKCYSVQGTGGASPLIYGLAYVSKDPDCSGISSSRIYITDTMDGKNSNCYNFKANITEDGTASGTYYLADAAGAYNATKDNTNVVLSGSRLWITNSTACYFEDPSGPSFLDRLEGRSYTSPKYDVPGAIEGIGALLNVPPCGYILDYKIDTCI